MNPAAAKEVIASGVSGGLIAYVGRTANGYDPFVYQRGIGATEVEISEDVFIIKKETAEEYLTATEKGPESENEGAEPKLTSESGGGGTGASDTRESDTETEVEVPPAIGERMKTITWSGEVPAQKWSTFYNRVLAKFAVGQGLKLTVNVEVSPDDGISKQKIDETRTSLRELGLNDRLIAD